MLGRLPRKSLCHKEVKPKLLGKQRSLLRGRVGEVEAAFDAVQAGLEGLDLRGQGCKVHAGLRFRPERGQIAAILQGTGTGERNESAEVYSGAGRQELADKELAEAEVISGYLPQQLSDDELADLVRAAVAAASTDGQAPSMKQMGQVIKAVQAEAAGRADGARISAAVKAALSG